jgi:hypothetical protein
MSKTDMRVRALTTYKCGKRSVKAAVGCGNRRNGTDCNSLFCKIGNNFFSKRSFQMKNKRCLVLGVALVLLALVAGVAFANPNYAVFQIINAETFEVINEGKLQGSEANYKVEDGFIKNNIRAQLGFPRNSDTRTVNGVTQRIIWVSVGVEG